MYIMIQIRLKSQTPSSPMNWVERRMQMTDWAKNTSEQEGKIFLFSHYGLVPSLILRDPELSAMAKAIYSYLLTYVNPEQMKNGSFHAWPSRKRILRELNISVNTLGKYLNELRDANLVVVEQIRKTLKDGKQVYGNNLYKLQTHVSESQYQGVVRTPDLPDTEKANSSKPDHLKTCDSPKVNTSNTKGLSSTKINSNTNFSTTSESKASSCSEEATVNFECKASL